jgi:hypothetical protein
MKASPDPDALVPQTTNIQVARSLRPYPINFSTIIAKVNLRGQLLGQ